MNDVRPKIGLALGGGVVLGAAHIGVLRAFAEHNIQIDAIAGTSAGAVVGACLASGVPLSEIERIAQNLGWLQIASMPNSILGIATNTKLGTLLENILPVKNIESTSIPLRILATEVARGRKKIFSSGSISEAVRASACVPIFFSPVEIDGELYVDGGLVENVPLSAFADMDLDILIGVNLTGYEKTFAPKALPDMIDLCIFLFSQHRDVPMRQLAHVLIEPDLQAFDVKDFKNLPLIIQAGYDAGIRAIPEITRLYAEKNIKESFITKFYKKYFAR
ncbi:MAG: patatin-like phospholipase family protein [Minisyncoccia bacterium]